MNDRFLTLKRLLFVLCATGLPFMANAQNVVEPLPPVDSLTDWQVNAFTQQFAALASNYEQILVGKSTIATNRKAGLEENLLAAKADSMVSKADRDSIAVLLKLAKKEEKTALRQQREATQALDLANKTVEADNDTKRKTLPKLWKQVHHVQEIVYPPAPLEQPEEAPQQSKPNKKPQKEKNVSAPPIEISEAEIIKLPPMPDSKPPTKAPTNTVRTKKYNPEEDVMLHPPALPCRMAVDTRDEFSGERFRRTAAIELFRNTPAALKNFLQDKPNVLCEAALSNSGAYAYLHLTFIINDPNPRKAFGKMDKESLATLTFLDGSTYNLYNQQLSEGIQNPDTQAFVFQAQYSLPAEALKKIRRTELDKIRIAWSSGYEDYDVQYVSLLKEQAKCLFEN